MRGFLIPVIPVIFIMLVIAGCALFIKRPGVTIKDIRIKSLNLSTLLLDVTVRLDNPNPIRIRMKSVSFDVSYLNGTEWAHISSGETGEISIKPGIHDVDVALNVQTSTIPGLIVGAFARREIRVQVKGMAVPDLFFLSSGIPFAETVTIPLDI